MMGKVVTIYVASDAGLPMQETPEVVARAGAGLVGDRYEGHRGAFSASGRQVIRHVTLIAVEDILVANQRLRCPFRLNETRRNILTLGIESLESLIGSEFRIGNDAVFRGVEPCKPCQRPSKLANKRWFAEAFAHRGGIRAEVLQGGIITSGSPIWL